MNDKRTESTLRIGPKNTFTLVLNAGRSGSTYLAHLLKSNYSESCLVLHEDIPPQITKPRVHNRAYRDDQFNAVMEDSSLSARLATWKKELSETSIIETGWTAYHLCPVLNRLFGDQFRMVVLHRDPVSFAFSRASMGNYHPKTFYDSAHEVSPFDSNSINPQYKSLWSSMNHFEKCMFWWFTVYKEAEEFRYKYPQVPYLEIRADDLFSGSRLNELLSFFGLKPSGLNVRDAPRNELPLFMRETFPIHDEWRQYLRHTTIIEFAERLGYRFEDCEIQRLAAKYKLPETWPAKLRHYTGFWRIRTTIAKPIKSIFQRL
jgi:hypothetical protein